MTPLQHRALAFIRTYVATNGGVSPTIDEIAAHLGNGKSGAHRLVVELERQGRITRDTRRQRSIALANPLAAFSSMELHAELERRDSDPAWQLGVASCGLCRLLPHDPSVGACTAPDCPQRIGKAA